MKAFRKSISVILAITVLLALFCIFSACFGTSGDNDDQGAQDTQGTQDTQGEKEDKEDKEDKQDQEEGDIVEGPGGLELIVLEDGTYGVSAFTAENITEVVIPSEYNGKSITSIESNAFKDCAGLTSITMPNTITSIGYYAFYGCAALKSITIPAGVTSIGGSLLSGCTELESITVLEGNTVYKSIGNCLIETESKTLVAGCKNSIIPDDGSVTSIGENAFYDCIGLVSIVIPDSVTSIGGYAFWGCAGLTSASIGSDFANMGYSAFNGCTALTGVTFKGTMARWNEIDPNEFWNSNSSIGTIYCTDGDLTVPNKI
ncbi:MAG: leucine-rich repeat domain-containing protein [Ruminococcaceae bacterium]|nr:leucine-rich repeat domain-containing protein [Oscillospiraceae bacterium]